MNRTGFFNPEQHKPEFTTGLRYSFVNEDIERTDHIIEHLSGKVRIIDYPNPGRFRLGLLDQLIQKDLVLGARLTHNSDQTQSFRIPLSARPISYDADSSNRGSFSYNDTKLFQDVGRILGEIAKIDADLPYVLSGGVGDSLAIVEFARPGERQLLLVPGAESLLYPVQGLEQARDYYLEHLHREFGTRFGNKNLVINFQSAFIETVGQGVLPQEWHGEGE